MELFLDDPNDNIDSNERNFAKKIHLLALLGSLLPPLNLLLPFVISKISNSNSKFIKIHTSNALNLQLIVLAFLFLAFILYLSLDIFYVLIFGLFIVIFQCIYTYNNYSAAKSGIVYKLPLSINYF